MRLLVTGSAGFIGSNFVRRWLADHPSDEVTGLDLVTYAGDPRSLADVEARHPGRYRLIRGDIASGTDVASAFDAARPHVVVNFAAESHNSRAVLDPGIFVRTNVVGTQILLDEARRRGVERFHHISTCEVYGDLELDSTHSFDEAAPYRPRTPYNASKAAADMIVRATFNTYGLPVTITNCSNNYGPYQHPEKVIPLFTTNALSGMPLPLYRNSEHRREWLAVEDHCDAIALVIQKGRSGDTYNVGSGEERSIEQIAEAVLGLLALPASMKSYVDDRPGHDRRYLLDHAKIARELGWSPTITFEEGLFRTVEWYRSNRAWWEPKKARATADVDETRWAVNSRP